MRGVYAVQYLFLMYNLKMKIIYFNYQTAF